MSSSLTAFCTVAPLFAEIGTLTVQKQGVVKKREKKEEGWKEKQVAEQKLSANL